MADAVLRDDQGPVALLTLNRPDRLNAWNGELEEAYWAHLDDCADDPSIRVIVVTGAGRGWCAGADMDVLQGIGSGGGGGGAPGRGRMQWHTTSIPKPVIAAINGACAGIGFVQAMFCDLRFAAAGAKFTTAFARRGLVAEYGVSWVLPRLIGPARAMDVLLSGRTFLAEEAETLGIVNRVMPADDLLPSTMAYAFELATYSSPASMAAMKRQVWGDLGRTIDDAGAHAVGLMQRSLKEADFTEGVQSFLQKRTPDFSPLSRGWATGDTAP
jgi:enoyl-CoA hydratase/carnithine racemase